MQQREAKGGDDPRDWKERRRTGRRKTKNAENDNKANQKIRRVLILRMHRVAV